MKQKNVITRKQVGFVVKKYRIKLSSIVVREDGLIDVRGNVHITGNKIFKLPLKFGNVTGDFYCKNNMLKTLKGSPKFVGGSFDCSDNELISLKEGPKYVGGNYFCQENKLISLKGCPLEVIGIFNCALNNLESLMFGPLRVGKSYYAHHNQLKKLTGAPDFLGGSLNVAANFLKNLEDCPYYIGANLHIDCWIPSLYMASKNCYVGGVKIESLERMDSGSSILSELILSNQNCLPILFKYGKYLELWDKDGLINPENLRDILLDIDEGLV